MLAVDNRSLHNCYGKEENIIVIERTRIELN